MKEPQGKTIKIDDRPALTPRQHQALLFVEDYIERRGYPPTVREVAEAMGLRSSHSGFKHLHVLARKGYIEIDGGPRALRIVK